ncbi:MAG TPA: ABC transporter permease, partial [Oscillospiraceae bacterium]|nr:ABC transporter permease [Oscillospiraceae bacterium]
LALGHNPVAVYADMVRGSLMTKTSLRETVKIAVPLLGAALAIAPAFRMKFWNIGAEGQILMGGIAASYVALFQYQNMSRGMLLFCMFVAGVVAGGLWGVVPAVFKAKWGTNETLFTLMFNYIALGVEQYLQNGPWRDPKGTGFPIIAMFDRVARLPKVFGVHIGWVIVLALVLFMYVYMNFSKQGYEIAVVGESVRTAQYVGMSVGRVIVRTMFLSGAVAGLVGVLNVAGADYTLNASTAGGVGFTAITVAWLAKLNPFAMIGIAFFLAILSKGSNTIQTDFKIPASAADVLTGTILFFLLGCEFFLQYRIVWRGKHTPEKSGETPEDKNPAGGSRPGAPDGEGGAV